MHTAHSLFKRYRYEFKSQELWMEIKFVLDGFAKTLTELFNVRIVKIFALDYYRILFLEHRWVDNFTQNQCGGSENSIQHSNNHFKSVLFSELSGKFYIHRLESVVNNPWKISGPSWAFWGQHCHVDGPFPYSSGSSGTMLRDWCKFLIWNLTFQLIFVPTQSGEEIGVMQELKSQICDNIALYARKYDEEFGMHLPGFVTDIWSLLIGTGPEPKFDLVRLNIFLLI